MEDEVTYPRIRFPGPRSQDNEANNTLGALEPTGGFVLPEAHQGFEWSSLSTLGECEPCRVASSPGVTHSWPHHRSPCDNRPVGLSAHTC